MDTFIFILEIGCLILLSGFFSASETSITASSEAKIHQLILQGNKRAKLVHKVRQDKEKFIGSILLLENGLNILSSSIVATNLVQIFGGDVVVYASMMMAVIILIFAEVLPKSFAFDNPEKFALTVIPIIHFFVLFFTPLTVAIQWFVSRFVKLILGKKPKEILSGADVIRGAIELSHHQGVVIKQDRDMLGGVLDLVEVDVEQIMIHRSEIFSLNFDLPTAELIKAAVNSTHTRIPMWQGNTDNIIGILHVRALFKMISENPNTDHEQIKTILAEPWFIPNTTTLRDQLQLFKKHRSHFALVIDEYGVLKGLITLEDILEEIVGEIEDELDLGDEDIFKLSENIYLVDGTINIRDINRYLELKLPDNDAHTVGGLIIHNLQRIPELGDELIMSNIKFKVLKVDNKKISKVEIEILK